MSEPPKKLGRPRKPGSPERNTYLTAERLREVINYDPETGALTWKIKRRKGNAGETAGSVSGGGYVQVGIDWGLHAAHRLAWLYVHGRYPDGDIDHINGDRTDNRLCNLRDVPRRMNAQNRRATLALTGVMGVSAKRGKFVARIWDGESNLYLGTFATAEEAGAAYIDAKLRLHAGFVA